MDVHNRHMIRKHFYLSEEQIGWLNKESKTKGFTASEILRWILNKFIAESKPSEVSASQSKRKEDE